MALTVESLTLELARALQPLQQRLAAGQVEELFVELGLPAPDVVLGAPGVVSSIGQAADAVRVLPAVVADLAAAVAGDDTTTLVAAVGRALPLVRAVLAAVDALGGAVSSAGATAGPAQAEVEAFAAQFPERLLGSLVADYLDRAHPEAGGVAGLLGLLESVPEAGTAHAAAHVRRSLRLDRLGPLLRDPAAALGGLYGWGTVAFAWDALLARLAPFASRVSSFAFVQPGADGGPASLRIGLVDLGPTVDATPGSPPGVAASLRGAVAQSAGLSVELAPGIAFEVGLASAVEAGASIELLPPARLEIEPPTAEVSGQARVGLAVTGNGPAGGGADPPLTLLGVAGGTRLQAGRLRLSAGADLSWDLPGRRAVGDFLVEAAVEDGRLVLSLEGADGFLSAILPRGGLGVDFDLLAGWSAARGLYFEGGAGLAIDIPVDVDLGPVRIQMLHLALGLDGDGLTLEASGAVSAKLGPFALAVDRMGTVARLSFPPPPGGNLGPADLAFAFKPPSGIGVSLDAGVVKGGGYLFIDPDAGQYAGVLELAFGPVSIKAIGILSTKLPSGADGWALLLLVFGEFPAVQLGFGFTLNGIGGVIGLQHGVSVEALQSGLRTGVLDAVLFPRDPVANAPTLLPQLRVVFPVVPRALTIGPALKLGWSTPPLVTLQLGLVLQFDDVLGAGPGQPSLSRVVLVGQLKVQIPPVDELGLDAPALIQLQVDVVGAYDFGDQALSIDAVLRDSHVALLPVTGSMVVRARFGTDPTFILAVGGFHPRFVDLPPGIPPQDRVGIQLQYGIVTVRIVGYLALTSNTVQTGAEASLVAAGGGFRVEAYLGFDALFVFDPVFHFEIDFRVGASIRYKSVSLASVRVSGRLSGPGRWEVSGSATISLLFFDVDIDFEVGWGDSPTPALPRIAVGPKIAAALSSPESWAAQLPTGGATLVSLRSVDAAGDVLAHPLGAVAGMQKVVPLGIHIDHVGRSLPSDGDRFDITGVEVGGAAQPVTLRDEHFARAEFLDLSEAEKLSSPSFEQFPAGVVAATDEFQVPATQIAFEPEWETVFLRQSRPSVRSVFDGAVLVGHARFGAVAQAPLRDAERLTPTAPPIVSVAPAAYTVTSAATPGAPMAGAVIASFTQAAQHAATLAASTVAAGALVTERAELASQP
jgi:hypothetical protein